MLKQRRQIEADLVRWGRGCRAAICGLLAAVVASGAGATPERHLLYQGKLQGVAPGMVEMRFSLVHGGDLGTPLYGPEEQLVPIGDSGRFSVKIGTGTLVPGAPNAALGDLDPDGLRLRISVKDQGSFQDLDPPVRLIPAFHTARASSLMDGSVSHESLARDVRIGLPPVGSVFPAATGVAPPGWLLCDGSLLEKNNYPDLYGVIGEAHGKSAAKFRIPDYRGRFLRGRLDGKKPNGSNQPWADRDLEAESRSTMNSGGAQGDAVGSVSYSQMPAHTHDFPNHSHNLVFPLGDWVPHSHGSDGTGSDEHLINANRREDLWQPWGFDFNYDPGIVVSGNMNSAGSVGALEGGEPRVRNASVEWMIRCGPRDAC